MPHGPFLRYTAPGLGLNPSEITAEPHFITTEPFCDSCCDGDYCGWDTKCCQQKIIKYLLFFIIGVIILMIILKSSK